MRRIPSFAGLLVLVGALACTRHGSTLELDAIETEIFEEEEVESDGTIAPTIRSVEAPTSRRRCSPTTTTRARPIGADEGLDRGTLRVQTKEGLREIPLQETSFDTLVVGTVAETNVTQVFANPFDEPIEAVYMFPLHEKAAVDDYWIRIGERSIRGVMKRREDARKIYEEAKQEGRRAGLLEQERPNIFTQSVANIMPGETIEVQMHVVQPLAQEDGRYTLVLPTVVGPRFIPGRPTGKQGAGEHPDTDQVPDASRITPPMSAGGDTACSPVAISVDIETGLAIHDVESKFHRVAFDRHDGVTTVALARATEIPNRDFELSWEMAGADPKAALMVQRDGDGDGGFFTLTIEPPTSILPEKAVPRDLIFVLDASGSMHGVPMDTAKDAVRAALRGMNPDDRFQILRFSEDASGFAEAPVPNTARNRERGLAYVDGLSGQGGTMMIEGVKAALGQPSEAGRVPTVLFLTDGYIGNEVEIFRAVADRLGRSRLFGLGVGSSVNRFLLDGLAAVGRGAVTYMGPGEDPDAVVERFYDRIAFPVLSDIELDFGTMAVHDVSPARIPDLFVGQPVVVYGRFDGAPAGEATIRGRLGAKPVSVPVRVDLADAEEGVGLASMWARMRIEELLRDPVVHTLAEAEVETRKKAAVRLALRHSVLTEFTAFVAVDHDERVGDDGDPKQVVVPVAVPEGVDGTFVGTGRGGGGTGEGTIGLGNIGLIGRGGGGGSGSGYGRGSGAGFGGRGKRVPRVRSADASVTGSLDKDVIRRIVRGHINEVRHCYNQGLADDPTLGGRIAIQFVIDALGKVATAVVASSTLPEDSKVGECIAEAVRHWKFPKVPGGGAVTITYPFVLSPG